MAVSMDLSNEVLNVFANSRRTEMTLIELHQNLTKRIPRITTDEVLRIIRLPNLVNLFNLQPISNNLCLIQLNPKITLCEACLQQGCKSMHCTKLHLCRYISHFSNKPLDRPCHFPHKLTEHPNNLTLLRRFNYDTLDDDLLLRVLRQHYEQTKPPASSSQNGHRRTNRTPMKPRPSPQLKKSPVPIENPLEKQLDISIPSERDAKDIDLEIVQLLLTTKDIIIEQILGKHISNEFYRRFTLQFKTKQIIDDILQKNPIIIYDNIPIKMKRTLRQRDSTIFALKFRTIQKIDNIRLNLYVETLIGKITSNIFDMTSDGNNEQIYLIRCEQKIDFDHLYKVYSAKNTLQGHHITIVEVYETETLEISFKHSPMRLPRLRQLIGETRWEQEVFACLCIRDQNIADIELLNAEITSKWLAEANRFERDVSLIIRPIIDFIQSDEKNEREEDDDEVTNLLQTPKTSSPYSPSNQSDDTPKDNDLNIYRIKPNWRIVLTHPIFGEEYRKYIRENLNISVQITGSSIEVENEYIRKELARYTNMFIQNFVFQEVSDLDKNQVKMVKDNYSRMAHKWQKDTTKTLLAARRDVMDELFPRPTSANRQQNKIQTTPTLRFKQSPIPKNQDKPLTPPIPTKTTEDNLPVLQYPIENNVHFPFFSPSNSFSDRLKTYLSSTFKIQLEIKRVSQAKFVLELKGQPKDISDARPALSSLFASLKTKIYSDKKNSRKFCIPDIDRVAQWNLDRCSIVSSCSYSPKNGGILSVRYFADDPYFGIDEQKIDDVIQHNLVSKSYQPIISSKKLEKNLEKLQNRIQQRSDYGQNICCLYNDQQEIPSIDISGTKPVVQEIDQEIQKVCDEYTPTPCNIQLQQNQIDYLLQFCLDDLIKFEEDYEDDGVDLQSKFKADSNQFVAPKYLHEKVKLLLFEMSLVQSISKDLKCSTQLLNNKKKELSNLAIKNRCLLKIKSSSSSSPPAQTTMSNIISGTIKVSNGDLTAEQSDVLVVCSTSTKLYDAVIKAAGPQVEQELTGKDMKTIVDTSAGQLKQAKRLLFISWTPPQAYSRNQDINALRQSISSFIQQAIKYAIKGEFQSIAFPAIGCGGFGILPNIIATIMIDTVNKELSINSSVQLAVTFVVQQPDVFDEFNAKLKSTLSPRSSSPSHSSTQEQVNITLTTVNSNINTAKQLLIHVEKMLS